MSDPSTPIFVPSRSSTPSPTPPVVDLTEMNHRIQQHRARGHPTRGQMATTPLTQSQIRRNAMEDAREYHEERADNLTNDYQRGHRYTSGHAAMIGHWSALHNAPVSEVLTAFAATPSIAIPFLLNVAPPPVHAEEPPIDDAALSDDWEIESQTFTPPLPVPPPLHNLPLDVIGPNREPMTPTDPVPSMPSSPCPPSLTPLP